MVSSNTEDALPEPRPAPHRLDLVIDFVNTFDRESGVDQLSTPVALAQWLVARGLLDAVSALNARELAGALSLREALRGAMLAHNGAPADGLDDARLEAVARGGKLEVQFTSAEEVRLVPREAGIAGALAALLIPVAHAIGDGSWSRAKACRAEDCQWAFYDRSRNRSGTWCEMAVCGNRTKVRAYRRRSSGAARGADPSGA
jgi:predicted RNA-binding Zn ribbon-like protein